MKILDDLLSGFKGNDFQVKSVHTCVFWTAVVSKHCGLSSTFRGEGATFKEVTGVKLLALTKTL